MKTWLNARVAEAIRKCTSDYRSGLGPQLCCELTGVEVDVAVQSIVTAIRSWNREIMAAYLWKGSTVRVCLLDVSEIEQVLHGVVATEQVVAIADLTMLGGCVVDFSLNEAETVDVLLTAWGKHESTATNVASQFPMTRTFRGN